MVGQKLPEIVHYREKWWSDREFRKSYQILDEKNDILKKYFVFSFSGDLDQV